MLYGESRRAFSTGLFAEPTAAYRGCPFWSWNNRLDREQLLRQVDYFKAMGMGGVTIHCRTGLGTEYLGAAFMDIVRACADKATREGMLTWLYDEDRWPSGFAGGLVTKDERYRLRHLLFTARPYGGQQDAVVDISSAVANRTENGVLLAVYDVVLGRDGTLARYRRLTPADAGMAPAEGVRRWYAYLETAEPAAWFNFQTYVDTLNPAATRRFIETTHERYRAVLGDAFGTSVPAIFTDEPQFARKAMLRDALSDSDITIPWTGDLVDTYKNANGHDILDRLPEVFWLPADGRASVARYRYHDHVAERFASAFADTLGHWCEGHGLALTGHMMEEPSLGSQTHSLGEAMRSYRAFHLPGIDMLCDAHEYTTAKQAQSAAHQYGREGVLSELYGVTGWHFDFVGHKAQGDWQAALGVTIRVHHLSWVSMAGEAKRDYPASIFYQSPWWREYRAVEDHFARVNVAMTRGKPVVRIGVIHPIESYWLAYGPQSETAAQRELMEDRFKGLTQWLLSANLDFDFVAESLLPTQRPRTVAGSDGVALGVGEMAYDVVLVPGLRTIRGSTLGALEAFAEAGGRVIFAGEVPELVDAEPSDRPRALAQRCERIGFSRPEVLAALEAVREVGIDPGAVTNWMVSHGPAASFLYQLRQDGDERYAFICNTDRDDPRPGAVIRFRGTWQVTALDTLTGKTTELGADYAEGWTCLRWGCPAHGHLLVRLSPGKRSTGAALTGEARERLGVVAEPVGVTLSEPNCLLLDQAEWRMDGGPWRAREEVLIIDNLARRELGLPLRDVHIAQPWVDTQADPVRGTLELRFRIVSEVDVAMPQLALEEPEVTEVMWDGERVLSVPRGYYVDEAIRTIDLPSMAKGEHELILRIPMCRKVNVEWCYLLGDFGVRVAGRDAVVTAPVRNLRWGSWVHQGLPFYGGNVTYHVPVDFGAGASLTVAVEKFASPVVAVDVNGGRVGSVGFAPFEVRLPGLSGRQVVDLTAYGNRANSFGPVHCANERLRWLGPNAWRTRGADYAYEYQLKPTGILAAPALLAGRPASGSRS